MNIVSSCITAFVLTAAGLGDSAEYIIDKERSVFAVVTHKAGVASAFAHNHFIHATAYDATLAAAESAPEATKFAATVQADQLGVDDPVMQARYAPLLREWGVLDEPFGGKLSGKQRAEIRSNMLAENQLNAAEYPEIAAELRGVRPLAANTAHGANYEATAAITIRGTAVETSFPARIQWDEDGLHITAVVPLTFSAFGIKPYSALLGAVRNQDQFHIVADFYARPAAAPQPTEQATP